MAGTIFGIPFDDEIFMNMWNEEPDPELLAMLNSGAVVDDAIDVYKRQGYNFEQFYFLDWRQEIVARADFTAVSRSRNIRPIH